MKWWNQDELWAWVLFIVLIVAMTAAAHGESRWAVGEVPKTVCKTRCLVQDMGACYKKEEYDCGVQFDYFLQLDGVHYMQAKSTEALTDFADALNNAREWRLSQDVPEKHNDPMPWPPHAPGTYNPCQDGACK